MKIAIDIKEMSFNQLVECWGMNLSAEEVIGVGLEIKHRLKESMVFNSDDRKFWERTLELTCKIKEARAKAKELEKLAKRIDIELGS